MKEDEREQKDQQISFLNLLTKLLKEQKLILIKYDT